ncbi:hypothetical protein BS329_20785 [Amycolatopsis coloradensis]|uniref:Cupin type-2 domain-containing protein n=1 Tax=Amycolatopsis coloradensis TaxID=76021 RepID=A0A1R0KR12_9PSEU|nr:cupin domain-containing protein [Amycolatopsis coloradensis]OLZ50063.1 hypothetical protein BS329_20785 [Amycolatopsis coloradensis]
MGKNGSRAHGIPTFSTPENVEKIEYYNTTFELPLRAEVTGGQFLMIRQREIPADAAPPFHVHTNEDEIWIINGGAFRFWTGGSSLATAEIFDVGPGAVVYGPRNVPHTFQSIDGLGDVTLLWSPADSQDYFLNVGQADSRKDTDGHDQLKRIGVHVLDRAPVAGR